MNRPDDPAALRALYEALVDRHAPNLWRLASRLTSDADEADDLVQETFYEAWRSIGSLREKPAARAWLIRILIHRAAHRLRTASRRVSPQATEEGQLLARPEAAPLTRLASKESLDDALARLAPPRRTAFLLVFQEGFSCREVSEMLDVPRGTVLSRLHRAREDLRGRLGPDAQAEAVV